MTLPKLQGWVLIGVLGMLSTGAGLSAIWTNLASLRVIRAIAPLLEASDQSKSVSPALCGSAQALLAGAPDVLAALHRAESFGGGRGSTARWLVEVNCALGDHAAAEAEASRFAREHGRSRDPLFALARGWNTAQTGNLSRAADEWREAPEILPAMLNWAEHAQFSGRPQDSLMLADYALAIDSECQRARFLKARGTDAAGALSAAFPLYERAVARSSASSASECAVAPSVIDFTYGRALHRAGRYEEAIAHLEQANRLSPDDPQPLVLLAEARWLGRLDAKGAEAAYRTAIEADPGYVWSYLGLAGLFLTLHQPAMALPLIRSAETYAGVGERERPLILLGQAQLQEGDYADALASLVRAREFGPQNGWSFYFMGQVFEAQGDVASALTAYQRAVELLPEDQGVSAALRKVQLRSSAP